MKALEKVALMAVKTAALKAALMVVYLVEMTVARREDWMVAMRVDSMVASMALITVALRGNWTVG